MKIPEIDIYNIHTWHKHPAVKEYFSYDSRDEEYDRPDFREREMMRRAIVKKAMERYSVDYADYVESGWEHTEQGPSIGGDSTWSHLKWDDEIIRDLTCMCRKIWEEEDEKV